MELLASEPSFGHVCSFCGREAVLLHAGERCTACRELEASRVYCAFTYREPLRTLIHSMKFSRLKPMAKVLGRLLAMRLGDQIPADALICWVPLSARRRRSRGFDQAEELARAAASLRNLPVQRLLKRIRHTPPQSLQSRENRFKHFENAFACSGETPLKGRVCVLIDDVMTTGATSSACVRILKEAGAVEVIVCVLARAV